MSTQLASSFVRRRTVRLLTGGLVLALLLSAFAPDLAMATGRDDPQVAPDLSSCPFCPWGISSIRTAR